MSERPATSRKGWWIASGILAILTLASVSCLLFLGSLNRSTPDRTLDTFCQSLLQADYRSAYDQFSAALQRTLSEEAFAAPLSQDRVTACTHSMASALGKSVLSQLKLVHISRGRNTDIVTLVKDSKNDWKIDDISRFSPAIQ